MLKPTKKIDPNVNSVPSWNDPEDPIPYLGGDPDPYDDDDDDDDDNGN